MIELSIAGARRGTSAPFRGAPRVLGGSWTALIELGGVGAFAEGGGCRSVRTTDDLAASVLVALNVAAGAARWQAALRAYGADAVPPFSTTSMTVLQETVEPERQGRVFGFVGIVMAVSMPLGMVVFGPLADRFTVESLLVVSGVLMFAVIGVAVALPSGRRAMRAASQGTGPAADLVEPVDAGAAR